VCPEGVQSDSWNRRRTNTRESDKGVTTMWTVKKIKMPLKMAKIIIETQITEKSI
jgi:hypothetical protein